MNHEILLHPNIPKPLHGVNPRSIKGQEWWDVVRQKAYASMDYHCHACGVHKSEAEYHNWLEAHEVFNIDYPSGRVEIESIVALCHACHNYIHDGRMIILVGKGEFDLEKYIHILRRGNEIIMRDWKHPFEPTLPIDREYKEVAEWSKWHLVLDDKKYFSPYRDYEAWEKHYA